MRILQKYKEKNIKKANVKVRKLQSFLIIDALKRVKNLYLLKTFYDFKKALKNIMFRK